WTGDGQGDRPGRDRAGQQAADGEGARAAAGVGRDEDAVGGAEGQGGAARDGVAEVTRVDGDDLAGRRRHGDGAAHSDDVVADEDGVGRGAGLEVAAGRRGDEDVLAVVARGAGEVGVRAQGGDAAGAVGRQV